GRNMPLTIGTRLGSYELTALLGKGGMGEVYRARDAKLKREVAIKILPDEFSRDGDRVSRFQREAEVLASLNHPNIAAIYDLQEANDARFLILELVEGETLAERIQRGPIPVEETIKIAHSICEALEAAHERGIIHRDLKPANVKITPDGKVKVLDFGLAKALETSPASTTLSNSPTMISATIGGVILRTAAYMSPEQVGGKMTVVRSDVWSFGAVLYEMLSGKPAFPGESVSEILASVLKIDPDWNALPPKTPRTIHKLIRRCLMKDRKQRLQAIGEARIIIADPTASEELQSAVSSRHSPWAIGAAITSLLAVVFALGWWQTFRPVAPGHLMNINFDLGEDAALDHAIPVIVSSDGTRMVYVSRRPDGRTQLSLRVLDQTVATVLVGTEDASHPFFSPDGQWVGFGAEGQLKKISTSGGKAVMLCDAPNFRGASWGENGMIVAALNSLGGL